MTKALNNINFLDKSITLSNKFNVPPADLSIEEYQELLSDFGYTSSYNKRHKLFILDKVDNPCELSIRVAITRRKVEFILNLMIDKKGKI